VCIFLRDDNSSRVNNEVFKLLFLYSTTYYSDFLTNYTMSQKKVTAYLLLWVCQIGLWTDFNENW